MIGAGVYLNGGAVDDGAAPPKELASLKDDPAFREFFKLQEGFEWNGKREISCTSGWNGVEKAREEIEKRVKSFSKEKLMLRLGAVHTVAIRLIACLERLLGRGSSMIPLTPSKRNCLRHESSNKN